MADKLRKYKAKRDFTDTPEPRGAQGVGAGEGRFVVQEHDATNLHWDLRLERDGVAVSWALPRGIPTHPDRNHLAVHVEDHPLEYLAFEGEIPQGSYGAGTVTIWDSGTYTAEKFRADEVIATFGGERLRGRYALFQTDGKSWMIHRMDPPADPNEEPMPDQVEPMLAKLAKLPRDDSLYTFEVKWDGARVICFCDGGHVKLQTRNLRDVTGEYPELRALGRALGSTRAILDGEVVALDDDGKPSFGLLQRRMHVASESTARRRAEETPATYMVFDLLYLNGHSTMSLPYAERRKLLEQLELEGPSWRTPSSHAGDGQAMLDASRQQDLEGVVAKRLDSTYEPGARTGAWLKIKNHREQELVVGGWLPGQGRRGKTIGSLALGYYEDRKRLVYAGNVGTGFSGEMLATLKRMLDSLATDESPFEGRQPPEQTVFIRPQLVVEVEFSEWTRAGTLRHPSFKGLREDKNPQDVVLERVEEVVEHER